MASLGGGIASDSHVYKCYGSTQFRPTTFTSMRMWYIDSPLLRLEDIDKLQNVASEHHTLRMVHKCSTQNSHARLMAHCEK